MIKHSSLKNTLHYLLNHSCETMKKKTANI